MREVRTTSLTPLKSTKLADFSQSQMSVRQMTLLLLVLVLVWVCAAAAASLKGPVAVNAGTAAARGKGTTVRRRLTPQQLRVINFLSGGVAGTVAGTLTLPLEVLKTQLQSSRGGKRGPVELAKLIFEREGLLGFFKGLQPMLIGIIPTRALYFWSYGETKNLLKAHLGDSPLNHLLSAFSAGVTSNTIMNPWWMVKTRFQIIADKSVGQVQFTSYSALVKHIYREEGIRGFYKGVTASYVGAIQGAIQWVVYENLKTRLQRKADKQAEKTHNADKTTKGKSAVPSKKGEISPTEYFVAAGLSKAVAVLASYPREVVRTRMQEQAVNGIFKYRGLLGTVSTVLKEEGLRGLYSGIGVHLARSVPTSAIMFVTFELIAKALAAYSTEDGAAGTGKIGRPARGGPSL